MLICNDPKETTNDYFLKEDNLLDDAPFRVAADQGDPGRMALLLQKQTTKTHSSIAMYNH